MLFSCLKGGIAIKIEVRGEDVHISGYVNATEKKSRPVMTPHGRVVEEIEPRAFAGAIQRAGNIPLTVDHGDKVYASTADRTLELREDDIGLHADVRAVDAELAAYAREGKIKGWSFGMYNVVDEVEERSGDLPLRRVKGLDLDHVTLVVNKSPVYSATSVEVRANGELAMEQRGHEETPEVTETALPDNSLFEYRIKLAKLRH